LKSEIFRNQDKLDFLEITADHYIGAGPERARELELLIDHFTVIPHGLSLSLGSAEGLDEEYTSKLIELVRRVDPPWWSEHVAFTRAGGRQIGHLAPLPFTREAVEVVVRNVREVQRRLDVPLILENISYTFRLPGAEMTEAQFLGEIVERTGCGLLLDVMNLYANATNHGYDAERALAQLPLDRVVQLHFVGGHWSDGVMVDSHAHPTPPEVWSLLELVLAHAPVKGVILERDEHFPPFDELLEEVERARAIGRGAGRWA
jgi:uncharacterized protein (UPF0276 family)